MRRARLPKPWLPMCRPRRPQIVLHLAAQALVRAGYADPLGTHATNVMGTAHVLDALRGQAGVRAVVVVTTDKVYRNREWAYPYREDDPLGGHDPYSGSKGSGRDHHRQLPRCIFGRSRAWPWLPRGRAM